MASDIRRLLLAVLLTGAALAAAQPAAPLSVSGTVETATRRPRKPTPGSITGCDELATFLGDEMGGEGTTLCPTNAALRAFARASGYRGWDALLKAAAAAPGQWRPYLQRLWSFHRVPDEVLGLPSLSAGVNGPYETALALASDEDGEALANAPLLFERGKKGVFAVTPSRQRVKVLGGSIVGEEGAFVVHAVGAVLMPPNTFHTIARALRARRELRKTSNYMSQAMRKAIRSAGTGGTVVAPTNEAWRGIRFPRGRKPKWPGGATGARVANNKQLKAALCNYFTVRAPSSDPDAEEGALEVLTREVLVERWRDAGGAAMMALPSTLVAGGERQQLYYIYDEALDKLYIVGGRNTRAVPMMAGGELAVRTLYAGTATVLAAGGASALPLRTGVKRFDKQPLPAWS